jgi:alpha-beta hydrolase superfamily lysophospholipase
MYPMASPTPKRTPQPAALAASPPEVVDPRWLLKALGLTLAVAAVFAYLSLCFLIYQGGWQRLLFPSHTVDKTPSDVVGFEALRFDAAETGRPRLAGWWLPASSPNRPTILFLHGATGSLSTCVRTLELLNRANLNILAFDYRGYGESDPPHPTEARMNEDATAALNYLLNTRHITAATIIPYGQGLGAVLAANLANAHPELPAIILDTPDPDAFERATGSGEFRLLPARTLMQDHFDLRAALGNSQKPKLLLADGPDGFQTASVQSNQALFRSLPDPKMTVTFQTPASEAAYLESTRRFLDEYVPSSIDNLSPKATQPKPGGEE